MANKNDSVVIKISGDIKDYTAKLKEVQSETSDLNDLLNKGGLIAGATFATVVLGATKAVNAFKASKQPGIELTNILKNQDFFSKELFDSYNAQAQALKKLVGADDEAVLSGIGVIQRFIGQKKVTDELTQAVLDYAAGTGKDLETAFKEVGKSIGTSTNVLARNGIVFSENATIQEKMETFIARTNASFKGQAKAISDNLGPSKKLGMVFEDILETVGEELEPIFDEITGALKSFGEAVEQNKDAGKVIAGIALAIGSFAGLSLVVIGVTKAIVALQVAAVALGTTITVLTGGIALLVVGLGALTVAGLEYAKSTDDIEKLNKRLIKSQEELIELRKKDVTGFGVAREITLKADEVKILQQKIEKLKSIQKIDSKSTEDEKAKAEAIKKANAEADEAFKKGDARKKALAKAESDANERLKERANLEKELADVGKSEIEKLESLRDKRLKIAESDADLRLKIEKDFQIEKLKLEQDSADKLREFRETEAKYDKERAEERLRAISGASGNPLKGLLDASNEKDTSKRNALAQGAGAGLLNSVAGGKEGARSLVVEGASMAIDAFAPGIGQALKPLLGQLSQGPEATKQFVKEFAEGIPEIVGALAEAIPVLIEELAKQFPVVIDKLVEKIPEITDAFVRATPEIVKALSLQMPLVANAFIKNIPEIVSSFIDGLIQGADDFVKALVDAVNPFSSGGPASKVTGGIGDVFGDIGDFLGFSEGGQASVKGVPSGYANDKFPAFLSSDELVVKPNVARDLESFLNSQSSGANNAQIMASLNFIAEKVSAPIQVISDVNVGYETFARIMLDISRSNGRTS